MRLIIATIVITVCLSLHTGPVRADLAEGQIFPNLNFSGTISAADRAYLGLTKPGPFSLKDIQAPYVLVEIFSDSCPHCILAAPGVNRLFRLIEGKPKLRGKDGRPAVLKMLGVGFYSKPEAMEVWRTKYNVSFPLIPDPQAVVGKALDIPGTPTYVLLDQQGRVLFVQPGELGSPRRFLQKVLSHLEF
jgi:thiol-disulfide isomerase/thioredoxin